MREAGFRSRTKKKFKAPTDSRHNLPVAPNLLDQVFTVDAPDRNWVGDIRPRKGGCIWPCSSTCSTARLSAGPPHLG
jgi:transposase InsO family protein